MLKRHTYSYHPITPASQSQDLLEKHICRPADRREEDEWAPDASGASVIERPYFTVIVIYDYLEGKLKGYKGKSREPGFEGAGFNSHWQS